MKTCKLLSKVWVSEPVKLHFSNESSGSYFEAAPGTPLTIIKNNKLTYTVAYMSKRKHWDGSGKYRVIETARLYKTDLNKISELSTSDDVARLLKVKVKGKSKKKKIRI